MLAAFQEIMPALVTMFSLRRNLQLFRNNRTDSSVSWGHHCRSIICALLRSSARASADLSIMFEYPLRVKDEIEP